MARTFVLTCDKCGSDRDVEGYSIGKSGAMPYEVDLCDKCAGTLDDYIDVGRQRMVGRGIHATGASREPELRTKIYSPEELDKMEEEYRKKNK